MHEIIEVDSWDKAKNEFRKLVNEGVWIFRGQPNEGELETSLERWIHKNQNKEILDEDSADLYMLTLFKQGAHHYLRSCAHLPDNTLEWLALMQHHGAPTRLLDFTRSPYIASFFAMDNAFPPEGKCVIWAVNTLLCNKQAVKLLNEQRTEKSGYPILSEFDYGAILENFEEIFISNPNLPQLILPISPDKKNERLTIQQGLFLCPGDPSSFMENLYYSGEYEEHVKRIIISNSCRRDAIEDLKLMNISHATLFPGLDGFARSLSNNIYIKKLK